MRGMLETGRLSAGPERAYPSSAPPGRPSGVALHPQGEKDVRLRPIADLEPECFNRRMFQQSLDKLGRSPLHYAAAEGAIGSSAALIDAGADASLADRAGWTPLHFAAQGGHAAMIKLLLDAGANVDPRDEHGNTPLSNAVFNYRGDGGAISALRSAGADENARNDHGVSPRSLAHSIANYDVAKLFP